MGVVRIRQGIRGKVILTRPKDADGFGHQRLLLRPPQFGFHHVPRRLGHDHFGRCYDRSFIFWIHDVHCKLLGGHNMLFLQRTGRQRSRLRKQPLMRQPVEDGPPASRFLMWILLHTRTHEWRTGNSAYSVRNRSRMR